MLLFLVNSQTNILTARDVVPSVLAQRGVVSRQQLRDRDCLVCVGDDAFVDVYDLTGIVASNAYPLYEYCLPVAPQRVLFSEWLIFAQANDCELWVVVRPRRAACGGAQPRRPVSRACRGVAQAPLRCNARAQSRCCVGALPIHVAHSRAAPAAANHAARDRGRKTVA